MNLWRQRIAKCQKSNLTVTAGVPAKRDRGILSTKSIPVLFVAGIKSNRERECPDRGRIPTGKRTATFHCYPFTGRTDNVPEVRHGNTVKPIGE